MALQKLLIPQDKANHYVYGQGVFALSWAGSYFPPTTLNSIESAAVALGIVAVFALGKEWYDKASGKGTPEWLDALWTIAGGLAPAVLLAACFLTKGGV